MIDPTTITDYNLTTAELEERLLFWVCAAGKNGATAARSLDKFLNTLQYNEFGPFDQIKLKCLDDNMPDDIIEESFPNYKKMSQLMKEAGIGCYNNKCRTFQELAFSKIDLRTCSVEELEKIYGIGKKTSRCFILHSRKNAQHAGLDTHLLKHLRAMGVEDVPIRTPSSNKQYLRLEKEVLRLAKEAGETPADYDLKVWKSYAVR